MRVLILGGNGLIGSEVVRVCARHGHDVTALARDPARAVQRMPAIRWRQADIAKLITPADWQSLLQNIEAVVNCAGALQDSARDDVAAVQSVAMVALYAAAKTANIRLIVQISAAANDSASEIPFLATKHQADEALKQSGLAFVILRPGIVIGRNAYGGSALLRALAAFPVITPLVHGDSRMQFAALSDVAATVTDALDGRIATGSDIGVAAPQELSLAEAVAMHRRWLGLPAARAVSVPGWAAALVAKGANLLGWVGWRSPLRSTALQVAAAGLAGQRPSGPAKTLEEALQATPAGAQDLWFARLYLLKPAIFGTLSLFWLLSGLIALLRFDASAAHLQAAGASAAVAAVLTVVTSLSDIALGLGVVVRRIAPLALKAMVVLSLAYLFGATVLTPSLWLDPLGPLVKVLPSIGLALVALAILDER